jgi:hypothetical protein
MNEQEKKAPRYNPERSLCTYAGEPLEGLVTASFTLIARLEGMAAVTGYLEKNGMVKCYAINSPLLSLYTLACPALGSLAPNRIIRELKEGGRLFSAGAAFCFEAMVPVSLSAAMPAMIKSILDNAFSLRTGFEYRHIPCLVLSADKSFRPVSPQAKPPVNTLDARDAPKQLYGPAARLCDYLDTRLTIPVVNGMAGEWLDITLPGELLTVERVGGWLGRYGLELTAAVQELRIFSLTGAR